MLGDDDVVWSLRGLFARSFVPQEGSSDSMVGKPFLEAKESYTKSHTNLYFEFASRFSRLYGDPGVQVDLLRGPGDVSSFTTTSTCVVVIHETLVVSLQPLGIYFQAHHHHEDLCCCCPRFRCFGFGLRPGPYRRECFVAGR